MIRVRYENGLLKPLEPLELREGVEPGVQLLPEEFPELVEKVSVEAKEGVGRVLRGPHALGRVVLDSSVLVESVLRPGSWLPQQRLPRWRHAARLEWS